MSKVAITNVRVFDDEKILPATTVVFEDGLITGIGKDHELTDGANIVDAKNGVLLPGLIDAHVHRLFFIQFTKPYAYLSFRGIGYKSRGCR